MLFHSSADRLGVAGVPVQTANQQKPTREEYLAYLRAVVLQFDLKVRTFERVEEARRTAQGFELRTIAVDGQHVYEVDVVVLAVGAMHAPRMLGVPGESLPHVSHYFGDPHSPPDDRLPAGDGALRHPAGEGSAFSARVSATG